MSPTTAISCTRLLQLRGDGSERDPRPGDTAVMPPGTPRVWSNGGDDELHMILRFTPALNTKEFFESYFDLVAAGKTDAKGIVVIPGRPRC